MVVVDVFISKIFIEPALAIKNMQFKSCHWRLSKPLDIKVFLFL